MTTTAIPNSIVLNFPTAATNPYVYCKDDGSVGAGGDSVFSTLVKIAVEQSTVRNDYFHLRFTNNNKYWQKSTDDDTIVAISNQPVEDTTNPSCTLFELVLDSDLLYMVHVQTGQDVSINNSTNVLHVSSPMSGLGFVDGETVVQLPTHIALIGDNGKYLKAYSNSGSRLQFGSDDANDGLSGHMVTLMPDGHVQLISDYYGMLWWMAASDANWIYSDWNDSKGSVITSVFWPIKIDENTIALRSTGNNMFCKRLNADGMYDCLAAITDTIDVYSRLQVQELVANRKIYNVTYRMEDAMIYGETPFLAGSSTLTNNTDQEDSMAVSIIYEDQKSYTFSRGVSLTAGVSITMEAGIPFIMEEEIEISFQINGSLQWDTTTTTTTSVTATGSVPVPANSIVRVDYVGTMGTCNIPYTYTQEDQSSTTGAIEYYNQTDGIYNGVSYYNFDFQVASVKPI